MDFRGQQFSEYLYYFLTVFFGGIAWFVGYFANDFQLTVYGWAVGLGLALILCIPDWPMYNKHPVQWAVKGGKPKDITEDNKKDKKEKKAKKGKSGDTSEKKEKKEKKEKGS